MSTNTISLQTLWNIYAVYQYFTQYSAALSSSQSLAASKVGQIVDKISPNVEHNTKTADWLNVMNAALGFASVGQSNSTFRSRPKRLLIGAIGVLGLRWHCSRYCRFCCQRYHDHDCGRSDGRPQNA
jgi:hypothetical protein